MPLSYDEQIRAGFHHNLAIVIGVHAMWSLGSAFYNWGTMMPVFLKELGASNFHIGLMQGLLSLAMFSPQMIAAQKTSHLAVKKFLFPCVHYPGLVAVGVMGVFTLAWGKSEAMIPVTIVCMTFMGLSLSFAIPMWSNLVAKLVPPQSRGISFGFIFFAGGVTGLVGASIAKYMIGRYEIIGFGWGFVGASLVLAVAVSFFFLLKEPAHPEPPIKKGIGEFFRGMKADLKGHRDYRFYLLSKSLSSLGTMALPFYAVAAVGRFGMGPEAGAEFTLMLILARMIGSPLFGWLGDRTGFRAVALFPPCINILCASLAIFSTQASTFYLIFFLIGLSTAADIASSLNLPIEYCPQADKTTFIAVKGTVTGPLMFVAPLLGGFLADSLAWEFNITFTTALLFEMAAFLILLILVNEPRRHSTSTSTTNKEEDPNE
ncbi:MAG: MFS transporter [Planctomycetota bacterium]|nr:MFS transporter [Planctomycetota bacterium]MDA1142202.1 MFS transporter [Planctomycetota bacterium]